MADSSIGFIGLGVMGGQMSQNLVRKSGAEVFVYDLSAERIDPLRQLGATVASSVAEIARRCDTIMLSLPGGPQVETVITGADGLLTHGRAGQTIIDLSTAPVELTRSMAEKLAGHGIGFADAPVARGPQAARDGTLSICVGSSPETFEKIRPLLAHLATDILHCGRVGSGQIVKIINNMVLFDITVALSEAATIGERSGIGRKLLFDALANGSADSFALRNLGMKTIVPDDYPTTGMSVEYALKDLGYAIDLADKAGVGVPSALLTRDKLQKAAAAGFGKQFFSVVTRLVGGA